jgi:anti-sigma B factor antagonist
MGFLLTTQVLSDTRVVLEIAGRLDAINAPALRGRFHDLIEEGRVEIVCNLKEVGFLDGSGLAALIWGMETARERNGFLKVAGLGEDVAETFRLTTLNRVFTIYPSIAAALS